jgi:tetratricopeptide (TPR) repeat protein
MRPFKHHIFSIRHFALFSLLLAVLCLSAPPQVFAKQAMWNACKSAKTASEKISTCSQAISSLRDRSILEQAYLLRGRAYMAQRQFDMATADFTKLIGLHPGLASYYQERQAAYKGAGNLQAALNDANKAIELAPKQASSYQNRGSLFGAMGRWQQALDDFNTALSMEPRNSGFLNMRGEALVKLNRPGDALHDFYSALLVDPKATYVLKGRALANMQLGNYQAAVSDIQLFIQAFPADSDGPRILASLKGSSNAPTTASAAGQVSTSGVTNLSDTVTKANILATFCQPQDIAGDSCKLVRGYPSEVPGAACNVELNGGIFSQRYEEAQLIYASYRSYCESHATSYGGSVLLQRAGSALKFVAFVRGTPIGSNCVTVAGDYDQDSLYCISQNDEIGQHQTWLATFEPVRQNADIFNVIRTTTIISASTSRDNDPVDCSKRVVYLEVSKLRAGPKPQTLLMDVRYADNDIIQAACASGGYKPANHDQAPKGSVFLAPGEAKSEPFVYDIQSREFSSLRRYLDETVLPSPGPVATSRAITVVPANEDRVALVIGNSDYKNVPALPNPQSDAAAIAEKFKALGFNKVTLVTNASQQEMISALSEFSDVANHADWAVVYFAGHGLVIDGKNYLIPVDATLKTDRQVALQTISLDQLTDAISGARKLRLIFLDACRDDPFLNQMTVTDASRSLSRGLARVEPNSGTVVVYAARDGAVAADGNAGSHSPFTTALLDNIGDAGVEINLLLRKVRDDVLHATENEQEPFIYGSLPGQAYYFVQ